MNEILEALKRQRELVDRARAENRDMTPDEIREFNAAQSVIDEFERQECEDTGKKKRKTAAKKPASEDEEDNEDEEEKKDPEKRSMDNTRAQAVKIINICRHFGVDPTSYIERGLTPQQVSAEIVNEHMRTASPLNTGIYITEDHRDKLHRAMVDGLLLRGGSSIENPAEGSNNYRGTSLREMAIECMSNENSSVDYRHMDTERFLSALQRDFYNPESFFPAIMDEVVKKSYVEGLKKANVSFDKFVRFGSLPNFKKTTNHEYIMSLGGRLERVPENGELKAYVPQDVAMPERQLDTFGRQFTMSRKAFIDDDIGLLTTMPRRYAAMSMRTQNEAVYDILLNNNKIFDGKTLFSAARKNTLTTGTDITLEAIQKMILMIGLQKDAAGNQLALVPDLFIVPLGLGVKVNTILRSQTINTTDNTQAANPYYGANFTVVEDVTLNGMVEEDSAIPWFMGVNREFMQVDYLNGQREATIRRSEKPGTLGFIWDVYFDFGVSMLHPEAICRNPGVKITVE